MVPVLETELSVEEHGGDHDGDADTRRGRRRGHGDQPPLGGLHRHRPLLPRGPRGEQPQETLTFAIPNMKFYPSWCTGQF